MIFKIQNFKNRSRLDVVTCFNVTRFETLSRYGDKSIFDALRKIEIFKKFWENFFGKSGVEFCEIFKQILYFTKLFWLRQTQKGGCFTYFGPCDPRFSENPGFRLVRQGPEVDFDRDHEPTLVNLRLKRSTPCRDLQGMIYLPKSDLDCYSVNFWRKVGRLLRSRFLTNRSKLGEVATDFRAAGYKLHESIQIQRNSRFWRISSVFGGSG